MENNNCFSEKSEQKSIWIFTIKIKVRLQILLSDIVAVIRIIIPAISVAFYRGTFSYIRR